MANEETRYETTTDQAAPVDALVGRDEVKDMLDTRITGAINELIKEHHLHPQEAADVLVDQAKAVLNALAWKPQAVQAAEKSLNEAANHLGY